MAAAALKFRRQWVIGDVTAPAGCLMRIVQQTIGEG